MDGSPGQDAHPDLAASSTCLPSIIFFSMAREWRYMSGLRAQIKLSVILALTSVAVSATSAFGQSPDTPPRSADKVIAAAPPPQVKQPEGKVAPSEPKPGNAGKTAAADDAKAPILQDELKAVKDDNAVVRELLRQMQEQQKTLLEEVEALRRQLGGGATTDASTANQPIVPTTPTDAQVQSQPVTVEATAQPKEDRFRDGMVIWETAEDARVPFLLKFNINSQIRYLNTTNSVDEFTDHLGVTREVHNRNDITVNRAMFILGGYVFNKKARYSFTVWTSAGAASIVVASNIGWTFNRAFSITGGYTGVPGSRSLVNTFPFFASTDRTMADNFFRPGFTQGIWANGEPANGLHYLAFLGNGLNTLNISAAKIDTHLLLSGSVWWEPLGPYGEPGKSRNMYDDYYSSDKVRVRLGTAYTRSREDRFSNLDQLSPENTSLYNSDGVLTFATGAFAPGVTVNLATYKMWAADAGVKWNGLAINGQYFWRWLDDFESDGPIPVTSTFDHGAEVSAGFFVKPKELMLYGRASWVRGQFGDSNEVGGGAKWYFLPTERIWMTAELFKINKAPYSGAFTPYVVGMTGWVPMIQTVLAF